MNRSKRHKGTKRSGWLLRPESRSKPRSKPMAPTRPVGSCSQRAPPKGESSPSRSLIQAAPASKGVRSLHGLPGWSRPIGSVLLTQRGLAATDQKQAAAPAFKRAHSDPVCACDRQPLPCSRTAAGTSWYTAAAGLGTLWYAAARADRRCNTSWVLHWTLGHRSQQRQAATAKRRAELGVGAGPGTWFVTTIVAAHACAAPQRLTVMSSVSMRPHLQTLRFRAKPKSTPMRCRRLLSRSSRSCKRWR